MALDVEIQDACLTQLTSPAFGSPIQMPRIAYSPTPGVKYARVQPIMRAEPDHRGVPFDATTIFAGVLQIDAVVPYGDGEQPGLLLAQKIADRFPIGLRLALSGGRKIEFNKPPAIAASLKDDTWVAYPVSISYLVLA